MKYSFNPTKGIFEDESGNKIAAMPSTNIPGKDVTVTQPAATNRDAGTQKLNFTQPQMDAMVARSQQGLNPSGDLPSIGNIAPAQAPQIPGQFDYESALTKMLTPQSDQFQKPLPIMGSVPDYVAPGKNPMVDWLAMTGGALRSMNPNDPFYRLVGGIGDQVKAAQTEKSNASLKDWIAKKSSADQEYKNSLARFTVEYNMFKDNKTASNNERKNKIGILKTLSENARKRADNKARVDTQLRIAGMHDSTSRTIASMRGTQGFDDKRADAINNQLRDAVTAQAAEIYPQAKIEHQTNIDFLRSELDKVMGYNRGDSTGQVAQATPNGLPPIVIQKRPGF